MNLKGLKHTAASIRAAYSCTSDATVFHFIEDALAEVERLESVGLDKAERLLKLFTEKFPPPEKCAHLFKIRQDGKPGLELVLSTDGVFNSFGFEPEDLRKDDREIVEEISRMLDIVKGVKNG